MSIVSATNTNQAQTFTSQPVNADAAPGTTSPLAVIGPAALSPEHKSPPSIKGRGVSYTTSQTAIPSLIRPGVVTATELQVPENIKLLLKKYGLNFDWFSNAEIVVHGCNNASITIREAEWKANPSLSFLDEARPALDFVVAELNKQTMTAESLCDRLNDLHCTWHREI